MKQILHHPLTRPIRKHRMPALLLLIATMVPAMAAATCNTQIVNQRTVVTATVLLGTSERCTAPVAAFPPPFTCLTDVIGNRTGGTTSSHVYDVGIPDIAACTTSDSIVYCYADGGAPPSGVPFQCIAEVHKDLLDLGSATSSSSCGCAVLKDAGF